MFLSSASTAAEPSDPSRRARDRKRQKPEQSQLRTLYWVYVCMIWRIQSFHKTIVIRLFDCTLHHRHLRTIIRLKKKTKRIHTCTNIWRLLRALYGTRTSPWLRLTINIKGLVLPRWDQTVDTTPSGPSARFQRDLKQAKSAVSPIE